MAADHGAGPGVGPAPGVRGARVAVFASLTCTRTIGDDVKDMEGTTDG